MTREDLLDELQKCLFEVEVEGITQHAKAERLLLRLRDLDMAVVPKRASSKTCEHGGHLISTGKGRAERTIAAANIYFSMVKKEDLNRSPFVLIRTAPRFARADKTILVPQEGQARVIHSGYRAF